MPSELIGAVGFAALIVLLALRVPVGISMIIVAVLGYSAIVNPNAALVRLSADTFEAASVQALSVIPLFVLMGILMERAGLGSDLYKLFDSLLFNVRGGLALATIGSATLFGAVSGSAMASTSTMSIVAVPEMRRHGYGDGLSTASAAVGGTLGMLIPPSAVLVFYGILTEESISRVLLAGVFPGLLTAALFMLTAYLVVLRRPDLGPVDRDRVRPALAPALKAAWAAPAIFGISMGGIYFGVFTATEAGAVGAASCLVYAVLSGRLKWSGFVDGVAATVRLSSAIFLIVIGGKLFGFFLSITRIPRGLSEAVGDLALPAFGVMMVIFLIYFILGALMDELAILVIMTPIIYPLVIDLGYNGVWFGVVSIMMLITGLLNPPVGIISFVVSGITGVDLMTVFRGIAPFMVALVVAVVLVVAFPQIALYLPNLMR